MLNNIFSALMSGASQSGASQQSQPGGGMLSGLLGSLMGGQSGGNQAASQPGGDLVSGLLGSFMGGGQTGSNPVMNLVNSGQNPMVNSLVQPVADQIGQKLGISPAVAMTAVTFAVHYMLSNHGSKLANGENLSGVLQQHTDPKYLHSAGVSKQLAKQTGMEPQAAASALLEVFKLL